MTGPAVAVSPVRAPTVFGIDPRPLTDLNGRVRVLVVDGQPLVPAGAARARDLTLTSREVEVLQLVAAGNSNKRIARALTIGAETAKTHLRNIIRKLDARDRTHAVIIGLRRGFIEF